VEDAVEKYEGRRTKEEKRNQNPFCTLYLLLCTYLEDAVKYDYARTDVDASKLQTEIAAAGLPVDHVLGGESGTTVVTTRDLDATEKTTLDGVVAAHVPPTPDESRRDQALRYYDDPDSPASLVELSGEYGLLALVNELQRKAGIAETGKAQLRNQVRAIIKPGG
jgi:hypothetical protein